MSAQSSILPLRRISRVIRLLLTSAIMLGLLTVHGLRAQQPAGGGQTVPPKSQVPPPTKKDSVPPASPSGQAVPPPGGSQPKAVSAPMPQGPIKNDDDPRVKA